MSNLTDGQEPVSSTQNGTTDGMIFSSVAMSAKTCASCLGRMVLRGTAWTRAEQGTWDEDMCGQPQGRNHKLIIGCTLTSASLLLLDDLRWGTASEGKKKDANHGRANTCTIFFYGSIEFHFSAAIPNCNSVAFPLCFSQATWEPSRARPAGTTDHQTQPAQVNLQLCIAPAIIRWDEQGPGGASWGDEPAPDLSRPNSSCSSDVSSFWDSAIECHRAAGGTKWSRRRHFDSTSSNQLWPVA
ncbi:hypothetical protein VFPPC_18173 [Pochonia chlamydosporia 170]|uniref:Uncharacterized protein n=1 Tax=Pochonia chlamydosporia 170 TaxID=1380566 RepID=A0A219ATM8_METCM|nr:hypothetical protein VFPPC_18173 [Pochonia chlamydosporia 170]OWT43624.1 hypothetical protein VFPPC_18173 [Pochonia chlamydosporia 170]